ncbi:MAG: MraY family glycosyltransferase [Pseudonocardiaceae bacterium]
MTFPPLLAPLVCFTVATAVQPIVIRMLRSGGVIDIPGIRSSHTIPTPRGGGIAVGLGLLVGIVIVGNSTWLPLIVALVFFFSIGLAEDLRGVPIAVRLSLQLPAGAVVTYLLTLSVPVHLLPRVVLIVIAAVWITGYVNAFNFMDGINGISGAHAVIGGLAFATIGVSYRHPSLVIVGAITAAAGLAFLPWNAGHARVFLGDVGSYTLGAVLAVLAVYSVLRGVPVEAVLAPLSLYVADTGWTLLRRILRKEDWRRPHRDHAYQRLCDAGWSHQRVSLLTFGVSLAVSALGIVGSSADAPVRVVADGLAVALLVAYLAAPRRLSERLAGGHGPEGYAGSTEPGGVRQEHDAGSEAADGTVHLSIERRHHEVREPQPGTGAARVLPGDRGPHRGRAPLPVATENGESAGAGAPGDPSE